MRNNSEQTLCKSDERLSVEQTREKTMQPTCIVASLRDVSWKRSLRSTDLPIVHPVGQFRDFWLNQPVGERLQTLGYEAFKLHY